MSLLVTWLSVLGLILFAIAIQVLGEWLYFQTDWEDWVIGIVAILLGSVWVALFLSFLSNLF